MFIGFEIKNTQGQAKPIVPEADIKLSQAVLDPKSYKKEPVTLFVEHNKKQFILAVIDPNHSWQCPLDLMFAAGCELKFFIRGPGSVHLTGFELRDDLDEDFDMSMSSDEEEEELGAGGDMVPHKSNLKTPPKANGIKLNGKKEVIKKGSAKKESAKKESAKKESAKKSNVNSARASNNQDDEDVSSDDEDFDIDDDDDDDSDLEDSYPSDEEMDDDIDLEALETCSSDDGVDEVVEDEESD